MTNSIDGREISRYNDPIAVNVVIGINIFSDIGVNYVDFFSYRFKKNGYQLAAIFVPSLIDT